MLRAAPALPIDGFVPVKLQAPKQVDNGFCTAGHAARRIQIVDSQEPLAVLLASVKKACDGGCDGACVERTCR